MLPTISRFSFVCVSSLLWCIAASEAQAGYVTLSLNSHSPSSPVFGSVSTDAGVYNWTVQAAAVSPADTSFYNSYMAGNVVHTFCVELDQSIEMRKTFTYQVVPLENVPGPGHLAGGSMGLQKADYIRELFGNYYTDNFTNTTAAAFQMAVWEIVSDPLDNWALRTGKYYGNTWTGDARSIAQGWLDQIATNGPQPDAFNSNPLLHGKTLIGLSSNSYQDQIALLDAHSAPVPSSLVLAVVGGVSLETGRRMRRRRRQAKDVC